MFRVNSERKMLLLEQECCKKDYNLFYLEDVTDNQKSKYSALHMLCWWYSSERIESQSLIHVSVSQLVMSSLRMLGIWVRTPRHETHNSLNQVATVRGQMHCNRWECHASSEMTIISGWPVRFLVPGIGQNIQSLTGNIRDVSIKE